MTENGHANGTGPRPEVRGAGAARSASEATPAAIRELADACVRYVERALGVKLDYEPETLPLVDHYLEQGRRAVRERREVASVLAQTVGAYFGEVVRRRYASWWRHEGDDPSLWQIELEPVYLSFSPVRLVEDALLVGSDVPPSDEFDQGASAFELEDTDRNAVAARLAELPPVSEEEYYALSTRLEVLDIAIEAIRARRIADGDPADAMLTPADYERD